MKTDLYEGDRPFCLALAATAAVQVFSLKSLISL